MRKKEFSQVQEGASDGLLACEEKYTESTFVNLLSQAMHNLRLMEQTMKSC